MVRIPAHREPTHPGEMLVEEENPDLYRKLRQNPTEELEPFVKMQVEAAQQAYQWSIDSGMRPDEAREVEREILFEYQPEGFSDPEEDEEFDSEMAEALISLYRQATAFSVIFRSVPTRPVTNSSLYTALLIDTHKVTICE